MAATTPQDAAPPAWAKERIDALRVRIAQGVRGKDEVVELALVAVIAGGHILLEDVPGVGKTTLAWSLASALGGQFRRVGRSSATSCWRMRSTAARPRRSPVCWRR